ATGFVLLITQGASTISDLTITDTTFTSGQVGIHDLFQSGTGTWSNFDFTQGTASAVSEPGSIAMLQLRTRPSWHVAPPPSSLSSN
ncbi:MAG: hypothetical protein ACI9DC_003211, partial [Gammaproteobacteria bacterium]